MTDLVWLGLEEALAIHGAVLAEHGGLQGIRDLALLGSALARPRHLTAYGTPDTYELGTAYTAGIVNSYPFVDGNKRTGLVMGILFLELNGVVFSAPEADATAAVFALASNELTEELYVSWLRENSNAA